MAFLDEFGEFAVHDLTWAPFASEDGFGNVTYGSPVLLKARTDLQSFEYSSGRGHTIEAHGRSYFSPVGATAKDQFTIHTGAVVQNISVWTIDDEKGVPHTTELIFG